MPSTDTCTARILPFRLRPEPDRSVSYDEALTIARSFLRTPIEDRPAALTDEVFGQTETVFAICRLLRDQMNAFPSKVEPEVAMLYSWLATPVRALGLFDEHNYLLGDVALIASTVYRHLGQSEEAERWLDRADAAFRHIVNPGPMLANLAYARLALRHDRRQYSQVLELLPSVISSFQEFGMKVEQAKAFFLEAMTLKEMGESEEAFQKFEKLRMSLRGTSETALLGRVLVEVGAQYSKAGNYSEASAVYGEALVVLCHGGDPMTVAHLKGELGETHRALGDLETAAEYYSAAVNDHASLGMAVKVAYGRVILAETLLALGRYREAEWQILAALPTIEEQKMVSEGFAAVALLGESVRRRATDPKALHELREHLQARS
jgi:tetratricopeptide (TPR) repeat protein